MFHTECLNLETNNWFSGGFGLGLLYPLNASRNYFFSFLLKCTLHSINSGELCSQRSRKTEENCHRISPASTPLSLILPCVSHSHTAQ